MQDIKRVAGLQRKSKPLSVKKTHGSLENLQLILAKTSSGIFIINGKLCTVHRTIPTQIGLNLHSLPTLQNYENNIINAMSFLVRLITQTNKIC